MTSNMTRLEVLESPEPNKTCDSAGRLLRCGCPRCRTSTAIARRIAEVIRTHPGPTYLVELKSRNTQDARTLAHFDLKYADEPCRAIRSPMADNYEQLCLLKRLAPNQGAGIQPSSTIATQPYRVVTQFGGAFEINFNRIGPVGFGIVYSEYGR